MTCALYAQVLVFSSFFPMSPPLALPNATPAAPLQLLGLNPSRAALGRLRRRHSDWAGSQATTCHRLAAEASMGHVCMPCALCAHVPVLSSFFPLLSPLLAPPNATLAAPLQLLAPQATRPHAAFPAAHHPCHAPATRAALAPAGPSCARR